jgi:hypothetical protein
VSERSAAVEEFVERVTRDLWEVTLGLEVRRAGSEEPSPALESRAPMRGGGAEEVVLRCAPELAREAAGVFFKRPPAELSAGDVEDALRELAHITAGNLRPSLKERPGRGARVPFRCNGRSLVVEVRP